MAGMFYGASSFNQNIGNWSTGSVADMSYMFAHTWRFNQEVGNWDTSHVENMSHMFSFAVEFNKNISCWSLCSTRDVTDMFCHAFRFPRSSLLENRAWQRVNPPECGVSIRNLTPTDVSSCLMASASTSTTAVDALELRETSSPQESAFSRLVLIAFAICCWIAIVLHALRWAKRRYLGALPKMEMQLEIMEPL
eukprot:6429456-Amphidinium_carterae.1